MWKWLLGLFIVSAAACGIGGYFAYRSPSVQDAIRSFSGQSKPTEVRIEHPQRGKLVRTVSAPGSIEARTNVKISAQVSSRITALPFRAGDDVKQDDTIVRLDAEDLAAQLESAQAARQGEEARLAGAQAALLQSRRELDRQQTLAETGDVSAAALQAAEADFLRAQSQLKVAEHAIEIAAANIQRARKDLSNTVIKSPIDGTITSLTAEVGELVVVGTLNNPASVIMEIADLSHMLMKARVDESRIAAVRAGQAARVFINAYEGRVFDGLVERVGLQRLVDSDRVGYFEVEIAISTAPGERLQTGLTANADAEVETLFDVIRVPTQAVVDRPIDELPADIRHSPLIDHTKRFARVAYRFIDGKARATPVSIGPSDLTHTVIIAGLSEDDQIITGPFKALVDMRDAKHVTDQAAKTTTTPSPQPQDQNPPTPAG